MYIRMLKKNTFESPKIKDMIINQRWGELANFKSFICFSQCVLNISDFPKFFTLRFFVIKFQIVCITAQVYAGQEFSNLTNGFQIWPMIFQLGQWFSQYIFRPKANAGFNRNWRFCILQLSHFYIIYLCIDIKASFVIINVAQL